MEKKIPIIVIVGPTASGKTKLSVDLAKRFDAEIISADSMQIYKYMDIATAKVHKDEMQGIPHHLIDILDPSEAYNVATFVQDASRAAQDIYSRGKLPILAGGTGLYVSSLIDGITFNEDQGDTQLREELYQYAKQEGAEALHRKLAEVDPEEAANIHPNNIVRVVRAIELYHTTGKPKTQHLRASKLQPSIFHPIVIGLSFDDREKLYQRIDLRVDLMLQSGLLEETKKILDMGYGLTASNAIGYKELIPYLSGERSLENCIEELKRNTRRYAKRQLTWFKRDKRTHWIYSDLCSNYDEILARASEIVRLGLTEMEDACEQKL